MRFANKVIKQFKQYLTSMFIDKYYTAMFIVFRETAFIHKWHIISLYNLWTIIIDNHYCSRFHVIVISLYTACSKIFSNNISI